ncbi:MAG: GDP-mannose dehydrogenase [Ignisphaera sp.]|uniref:GDP-mannose dehydrogenase n=1 Tax=Ignisphaera aggregans TaxID=334771 RepID=A0A7J3MXB4_9CREN
MERVLVVGLGEVGSAIYHVIKGVSKFKVYGYDVDPSKSTDSFESIEKPVDYLHIAIPYTSSFIDIVKDYVEIFKPKIVFIHSTVAIGTTRALHASAKTIVAYTPIRGKHPNLVKHILFWSKWIASIPIEEIEKCAKHLLEAGFKVRMYRGFPESLELAKLWETVYRAIMIASWQELHRVAKRFGVDIEVVAEFIGEVHEVLKDRPIYYPSYIGGHCLIPNTKMLMSHYKSKLFEFVLESNDKRLKELNDIDVLNDIEKIKTVAKKYMNLDYYGGKIE